MDNIEQNQAIIRVCEELRRAAKSNAYDDVKEIAAMKAILSEPHTDREVSQFFYNICDNLSGNLKIERQNIDRIIPALKNHIYQKRDKKSIPAYIRLKIIAEANGKCAICGKKKDDLVVDHIIPAKYVDNCLGDKNLQAICKKCKQKKYNL